MGDTRLLNKVDAYIQEHLLQISEEEEFLKLPRLKVRGKIYKGTCVCIHYLLTVAESLSMFQAWL